MPAKEAATGFVEQRMADHLRITATHDVDARLGAGWSDIHLVHQAPATDFAEIDLSTDVLGTVHYVVLGETRSWLDDLGWATSLSARERSK